MSKETAKAQGTRSSFPEGPCPSGTTGVVSWGVSGTPLCTFSCWEVGKEQRWPIPLNIVFMIRLDGALSLHGKTWALLKRYEYVYVHVCVHARAFIQCLVKHLESFLEL